MKRGECEGRDHARMCEPSTFSPTPHSARVIALTENIVACTGLFPTPCVMGGDALFAVSLLQMLGAFLCIVRERESHHCSQCTIVSSDSRGPALKSVPSVYATGISEVCITAS